MNSDLNQETGLKTGMTTGDSTNRERGGGAKFNFDESMERELYRDFEQASGDQNYSGYGSNDEYLNENSGTREEAGGSGTPLNADNPGMAVESRKDEGRRNGNLNNAGNVTMRPNSAADSFVYKGQLDAEKVFHRYKSETDITDLENKDNIDIVLMQSRGEKYSTNISDGQERQKMYREVNNQGQLDVDAIDKEYEQHEGVVAENTNRSVFERKGMDKLKENGIGRAQVILEQSYEREFDSNRPYFTQKIGEDARSKGNRGYGINASQILGARENFVGGGYESRYQRVHANKYQVPNSIINAYEDTENLSRQSNYDDELEMVGMLDKYRLANVEAPNSLIESLFDSDEEQTKDEDQMENLNTEDMQDIDADVKQDIAREIEELDMQNEELGAGHEATEDFYAHHERGKRRGVFTVMSRESESVLNEGDVGDDEYEGRVNVNHVGVGGDESVEEKQTDMFSVKEEDRNVISLEDFDELEISQDEYEQKKGNSVRRTLKVDTRFDRQARKGRVEQTLEELNSERGSNIDNVNFDDSMEESMSGLVIEGKITPKMSPERSNLFDTPGEYPSVDRKNLGNYPNYINSARGRGRIGVGVIGSNQNKKNIGMQTDYYSSDDEISGPAVRTPMLSSAQNSLKKTQRVYDSGSKRQTNSDGRTRLPRMENYMETPSLNPNVNKGARRPGNLQSYALMKQQLSAGSVRSGRGQMDRKITPTVGKSFDSMGVQPQTPEKSGSKSNSTARTNVGVDSGGRAGISKYFETPKDYLLSERKSGERYTKNSGGNYPDYYGAKISALQDNRHLPNEAKMKEEIKKSVYRVIKNIELAPLQKEIESIKKKLEMSDIRNSADNVAQVENVLEMYKSELLKILEHKDIHMKTGSGVSERDSGSRCRNRSRDRSNSRSKSRSEGRDRFGTESRNKSNDMEGAFARYTSFRKGYPTKPSSAAYSLAKYDASYNDEDQIDAKDDKRIGRLQGRFNTWFVENDPFLKKMDTESYYQNQSQHRSQHRNQNYSHKLRNSRNDISDETSPSSSYEFLPINKDSSKHSGSVTSTKSSADKKQMVIDLLSLELSDLKAKYKAKFDKLSQLNPAIYSELQEYRTLTDELRSLNGLMDIKTEEIAALSQLR
ncbi:hypothetical protein AX774_g1919 [Zancudomyces culisetae]|uniref:Uncharacterized protein n=1 Tax=Zancudomyces culisetae TaxID=1213189 RepID=A0A1R1PU99_ZANCU|nr:hypothetical protein AX774_g1919 [Zancudomyces culisetae]|eukprot:OMH84548.1 hypothetical protein AX774_g1919 [Zancudomyces culisetae]